MKSLRARALLSALIAVSVLGFGRAGALPGDGWTQVSTTGPAARLSATMAYDSHAGVVVLFGGWTRQRNGSLVPSNDTWIWNGITWTQAHPLVSPPPRTGGAMTYDASNDRIVLFGGSTPSSSFASDTWTWNGATWTQISTRIHPPGRVFAAMSYDDARGNIVLFGGDVYNRKTYSQVTSDTWILQGSSWHKVSPTRSPPARAASAIATIPRIGVYLFGGRGRYGRPLGDSWVWNGVTWSTPKSLTSGDRPQPRMGANLAYDGEGCLVLHGGFDYPVHAFDQTFITDGSIWSRNQSPEGLGTRVEATMAEAPGGGVMLFGGVQNGNGGTFYSDTWLWRTPVSSTCLMNTLP